MSVVITTIVTGAAMHYAHVLVHEAAHAALLWLFFRDRGRVRMRMRMLQGAGYASLRGWEGPPPTDRDLRRYALAQFVGPLVTVSTVGVLLPVGLVIFNRLPATLSSSQVGISLAALSVALATMCGLAVCCCAPGHDVWLMRAALRAARATERGVQLPLTLHEAIVAYAPPRRRGSRSSGAPDHRSRS